MLLDLASLSENREKVSGLSDNRKKFWVSLTIEKQFWVMKQGIEKTFWATLRIEKKFWVMKQQIEEKNREKVFGPSENRENVLGNEIANREKEQRKSFGPL